MVILKVTSIAKKAYTFEDGQIVYTKIHEAFEKGDGVILSFEGVDSIPSSFANGCFVKLLETYGMQRIKSSLKIENSTKQINGMIKARLDFEQKRLNGEG